jgi:hypothetical protein
MFDKESFVRIFAYKLIKNAYFEGFIIFLIIASSIKLFADTYDEMFSPQILYID